MHSVRHYCLLNNLNCLIYLNINIFCSTGRYGFLSELECPNNRRGAESLTACVSINANRPQQNEGLDVPVILIVACNSLCFTETQYNCDFESNLSLYSTVLWNLSEKLSFNYNGVTECSKGCDTLGIVQILKHNWKDSKLETKQEKKYLNKIKYEKSRFNFVIWFHTWARYLIWSSGYI